MKKLSAFLTAFALLGLVSCESDKPKNPNDAAISESAEEIPSEPVFTEYDQSDFAQINVAINKQDGEPVMPVNTYALQKLADEKIQSPCKLPENREKIIDEQRKEIYFSHTIWNEETTVYTNEFDEEGFNAFCDEPSEAFFNNFAVCGDKVAVYADFDEICDYGHCCKLLEYDVKTKEVRELYSYSSTENGEQITDITYFGGELYVIRKHKGTPLEVCRLTDGNLEPLFTTDDISVELGEYPYFRFVKQDTEKLMMTVNVNELTYEDSDTVYYAYHLIEYDTETGKISEVFYEEDESNIGKWMDHKVLVNGDDIIRTELDENKKTCIVGNNFRINTDIKGLQIQSAEGNRIIAWVDDTIKKEMYTYDLDNMECYVSNITGVYEINLIGGNVMMRYGMGEHVTHTLLIPELGASFNVFVSTMGLYRGYDDGKLWFIDAANGWSSGTDEDGVTSYFTKDGDAVGELVIIGG